MTERSPERSGGHGRETVVADRLPDPVAYGLAGAVGLVGGQLLASDPAADLLTARLGVPVRDHEDRRTWRAPRRLEVDRRELGD